MSRVCEKITVGLRHPWRFCARQLYRSLVIFPFEFIVSVCGWLYVRSTPETVNASVGTCFVVTSLIYCNDRPLTYGVRSHFLAEERATQTLATIRSIRQYAPGAVIVLIEAGLREDIPEEIKKSADRYVYVGNKIIVRATCDSRFKSLGETTLLLVGQRFLPQAKQYVKMSGRYWLNEEFNLSAWHGKNFTFYYIRPDFISTRLYRFSARATRHWRLALIKSLPYLFLDYPIEYLLQKCIPNSCIDTVHRVGVSGFDGVTGTDIKE